MNGTDTSQGRHNGRHNGMDRQPSPEELERELGRTRADLNETLHAIERRFSREQLVDQALDYLRGGPREFASNLANQARDNPIPVVLTAIGLGWLMAAGQRAPHGPEYTSEGLPESGPSVKTRGKEAVEKGKEAYGSAAESMHHLGETVGEKSEALRETMGEKFSGAHEGMERARKGLRFRARAVASGMRRGSEGTASGIRHSGEKTRDTFSYLLREQPLTLAALGIALGAGLAAGLPTTRRERETFGPVRDETVNRAREVGREQMEKTREDLKQAVSEPPPHPGPN
jgi:hypothetical protein